jgi:hypothetical protein
VGPDDVAAAVVDALKHPRPDVYVPARLGHLVRFATAMPRGFSDFLSRVFKAERAVLDAVDHVARRDYEARIAPVAAAPSSEKEPA